MSRRYIVGMLWVIGGYFLIGETTNYLSATGVLILTLGVAHLIRLVEGR